MIYWLFKRYMIRLIDEYADAYEAEQTASGNLHMRPDVYWLQRYLSGKFEWKKGDDGLGYVRKGK